MNWKIAIGTPYCGKVKYGVQWRNKLNFKILENWANSSQKKVILKNLQLWIVDESAFLE